MNKNRMYDEEIRRVLRNNTLVFYKINGSNEDLLREFNPSENFYYQMQKTIDKMQHNQRLYYTPAQAAVRRAAIIIISTALVLGTVSFSVKAIREPIIRFFRQTFDRFTEFTSTTSDVDFWLNEYDDDTCFVPTYVPEGYFIKTKELLYGRCYITYENADGSQIWYRQLEAKFLINIRLDTENAEVHDIIVNGQKAIWYKNKGYTNLFAYTSSGCCFLYWKGSLEELRQMAESIEKVEKNNVK